MYITFFGGDIIKTIKDSLYYDEKWKPLKYKDIKKNMYEISSYGRIRRTDNKHILSAPVAPNGYIRISLMTDGSRTDRSDPFRNAFSVHILVFYHFCNKEDIRTYDESNSQNERKYVINHKDCDKTNNYFMNLELMTYSENNIHAFDNGCCGRGEDNPGACEWITNDIVEQICVLLEDATPTKDIITKLELEDSSYTRNLISELYTGDRWSFIANKYSFRDPSKRIRRSKAYSKSFITEICDYIEAGYENYKIADIMIRKHDLSENEYNKIKGLVSFIRTRRRYTNISDNYTFWKEGSTTIESIV